MTNRLNPDQINAIVDDVVGPAWKEEKIHEVLGKLNALYERVYQRAQAEIFDGLALKIEIPAVFGKLQNMALDDLTNHKLTVDELMFAVSYDVATRVKERIT